MEKSRRNGRSLQYEPLESREMMAVTGSLSWNATLPPVDTTPPTVTSTGPASGAINVAAVSASVSSLWQNTATPGTVDSNDTGSVELGVKFTSDVNGYITGVKFYKAAGNTGTHVAHLWTSSGQLLATATFTSESASGWQQVNFATPVAVTAGTTYVASYFAPKGHFSVDRYYFASPKNSGVLHTPAGAGVFQYGSSSAFPGQSYANSNYWVDVVLSSTPPADTTTPTVTSTNPAAGAINVATSASIAISFSEAMDAATISNSSVKLLDGSSIITATVTFNSNTNSVTITPTAPLSNSKTYTISVAGVKDLAGNALAQNFSSTFTTLAASASVSSLWQNTATPGTVDSNDTGSVELGVKFTSDVNGYITGVKFYKAAGNTGTHVAHLWTSSGQLLATATFTSESASGWQQVNFATPVAVTAGTTYVASYFAPKGHFSVDRYYFASPKNSGVLHTPAGAGVFQYGSSSAFPGQSYANSNYWVDVVLSSTPPADTTTPTVTSTNPAAGAINVATSASIAISFSEAMDAATISNSSVKLLDGSSIITATVTFNSNTNSVTITPTAPLSNSKTYTISVAGVKDLAGNALAQNFSSTFTTLAADTTTPTVSGISLANGTTNVATSTAITITFSEALNASTVNTTTIQLLNGSTSVAATVTYNASAKTATITPNAALSNSTTYTVSILGGTNGVKDAVGNALAQNFSSTFTTVAATLPPDPTNWFDSHVIDAALRTLGHNLYTDGLIDRNDMISLLRNAEDGSVVDATELTDLRTIASSTTLFGSFDYVAKLSSYVVTANTANAKYQGTALGNLAAGSSSAQMENLINKWFLGTDRPTAGGAYRQIAGQLFVNGATYSDIHQGSLGDCYFVASLGEVALKNQAAITNLFIVNGDGTYTVRFFQNSVAQYVTVDSYLPTDSGGGLLYANRGAMYSNSSNELWTALAEKAYVQMNEMGWVRGSMTGTGQNSYAAIEGGYIYAALGHITGQATAAFAYTTGASAFTTFVNAYNQGKSIGFASKTTPSSSSVVGSHAYAVVGYDATNQTITLFNPWGTEYGLVTMTWAQIQGSFSYFDRTV